jgi:endoglucanase
MFELVKTLCALPGVSGREHRVAEAIEQIARPYAEDITRDALGNLIVRKKGRVTPQKPIMLAAHMDEVGFMVNHITKDGLIKVISVGTLYGQTLAGRMLWFPRTDIYGVLGQAPTHLRKKSDAVPTLDDMYIDIGAKDQQDAEQYVRLGDFAVFSTVTEDFGDDYIIGKALDDRMGCAILLKLLEQDLPVDVTFVFTVQEELGLRGAATSAFSVRPGTAIVVDVAFAADNGGFKDADRIACVGQGPLLSFADRVTVYDLELFETVCDLADKNQIPWQTKTRISGGTDAGAIHKAAAGAKVIGVSLAGRNTHTAASVLSKTDAQNALILLEKILEYLSHA